VLSSIYGLLLELLVLALDPLLGAEPLAPDALDPELLLPGLLAEPWFVLDHAGVETEELVMLRVRELLLLPELVP